MLNVLSVLSRYAKMGLRHQEKEHCNNNVCSNQLKMQVCAFNRQGGNLQKGLLWHCVLLDVRLQYMYAPMPVQPVCELIILTAGPGLYLTLNYGTHGRATGISCNWHAHRAVCPCGLAVLPDVQHRACPSPTDPPGAALRCGAWAVVLVQPCVHGPSWAGCGRAPEQCS